MKKEPPKTTIDEFCNFMDLPKMETFGKLHNFKWYVEKDPPEGDNGFPAMVRENLKQNTFEILDADQIGVAMELFL